VDILDGVEPDMGSNSGKEYVRARPQALHSDFLAPNIDNTADGFIPE
jgi:hypothetical protein